MAAPLPPPRYAAIIAELEEFLAMAALDDLPPREIVGEFGARARAAGLSVARFYIAWRLLDPVVDSRTLFWTPRGGVTEETWSHSAGVREDFLRSPIYYMLSAQDDTYRCRLVGANAPFRFPVFHEMVADGFTDYLICRVGFGQGATLDRPGAGVMLSFASDASSGFSDDELAVLGRIKYMLALSVRSTMQTDMGASLARTYLPRTASNKVLDGQIRLGTGERLDALVWYCDLRGSTALCERLGTERYLPLLNDFFAATAKPVAENGGDVLDYIGDAVLAIFPLGADAVSQALTATREVEASLATLAERHRDALGERTTTADLCGVAMDIGPVVYGNIGIHERMAYSAIGPTVNRVCRMERMTKTFGVPIVVSAAVARHAGEGWTSLGRPALEGIEDPPELFTCR